MRYFFFFVYGRTVSTPIYNYLEKIIKFHLVAHLPFALLTFSISGVPKSERVMFYCLYFRLNHSFEEQLTVVIAKILSIYRDTAARLVNSRHNLNSK